MVESTLNIRQISTERNLGSIVVMVTIMMRMRMNWKPMMIIG